VWNGFFGNMLCINGLCLFGVLFELEVVLVVCDEEVVVLFVVMLCVVVEVCCYCYVMLNVLWELVLVIMWFVSLCVLSVLLFVEDGMVVVYVFWIWLFGWLVVFG